MPSKKQGRAQKLVAELKELYLRTDSEVAGQGLFFKAKTHASALGGSVDKNVELLARIKDIILALESEL